MLKGKSFCFRFGDLNKKVKSHAANLFCGSFRLRPNFGILDAINEFMPRGG